MADMMKKMGKGGMMKQALKQMMGKGGGMPDMSGVSPEEMQAAAAAMKGKLPPGMGGMGGFPGMPGGMKLPPGLSGLGMGKKK